MEKTTLQQGLNEVARKRVHRMIDNNQPLFRQTMQRLMQEAGTANDYLASIGAANRTQAAPDVIFLEDGNKLIMNMGCIAMPWDSWPRKSPYPPNICGNSPKAPPGSASSRQRY